MLRSVWLRRIAWLEPLWVLAVGGVLLVPPRFLPAELRPYLEWGRPYAVGALAAGWPLRLLAYGRLSVRTPLDWPLAFLLLWLPVNFWASADKAISWEALSYLAFGLALYFALLNWPPARRRPQLVAWLILLIGAGLTVTAPLLSELALSKLWRPAPLEPFLRRLAALTPGNVNANRVAGVLIVVLPLCVALILRRDWSRWWWPPWVCGLLAGMMLGILLLAQSRGAYMAAAASLGLVLLLRWPRLAYAIAGLLLVLALGLLRLGPGVLLDQLGGGTALSSLEGRLEVWSRALYALADFPFTGIGIGTFDLVIPLLYPFFLIGPDTRVSHAHNLFLQVGLDLGIPGLIAYLALLMNAFALLGIALRQRERALTWTLAAGTAGGLTAFLVHGLTDAPLWGSKPAFLPWLLIALAVLLGLQTSAVSQDPGASPSARAV